MNSQVISTTVSSIITEKFHLDSRYGILITTILSSVMAYINFENFSLYLILIFLAGIYYVSQNFSFKNVHIVLECEEDLNMINKFLELFPEYILTPSYSTAKDKFGEIRLTSDVEFRDVLNKVTGKFSPKIFNETVENRDFKREITVRNLCMYTIGEIPSIYMEKIEDMIKERNKVCSKIKLSMTRIIPRLKGGGYDYHNFPFYAGFRDKIGTVYADSYFHQKKAEIFNIVKKVCSEEKVFSDFGTEPACSMILYGPPGTGKSSLVYRLAMTFKRDIIVVDLSKFLKDWDYAYRIVHRSEAHTHTGNKAIILFEEFDIAFDFIRKNSVEKNLSMTELMSEISLLSQVSYKKEKKEKEENETTSFLDQRKVCISDLLELIQGPVPTKGSIIIATTNKFDEMFKVCPALFRHGRLTPFHIDYINWEILQELVFYYFHNKLSFGPMKIEIPTSQIVDLVMECRECGTEPAIGFRLFENKLRNMCSIKTEKNLLKEV